MKKFLGFIIFSLTLICGFYIFNLYNLIRQYGEKEPVYLYEQQVFAYNSDTSYREVEEAPVFSVYVNNGFSEAFATMDEALLFAADKKKAYISDNFGNILWSNIPEYMVKIGKLESEFSDLNTAMYFARINENAQIINLKDGRIIWEKEGGGKGAVFMDIPLIKQYPELPRGCEVTSLAMLINYNGFDTTKMELAEKIKKNPNTYFVNNGIKYGGNPNNGFVGDMYNRSIHGLGVYNQPIYEVLKEYFPYSAINYTGCAFEDLYFSLDHSQPVWVIINSTYKPLNDSEFETWVTENGEIKITYKEHSVLIVGYDENYIYFNDPMGYKNKALKDDFIKAWEQMGAQAVSVTPFE